MRWTGRRLHFVGIAGAGMSGLATVARDLGAEVTGSDRATTGHDADNVPPDAEVVVSSAIPEDNPERQVARRRGQRELHRAELLGELTRLKPTIAVTGTHGKTTTTSMVVHALAACGGDPSYLVGGRVRSTGANAAWGSGEWLVVEADESDRSLLRLSPRIAVLTNAELDHHATYASLREVHATFREFLELAQDAVVLDEPELVGLASGRVHPYDVPAPRLTPEGSEFELDGVRVELGVPGAHNALNAAAAITACRVAGFDAARVAAGLRDFAGAGRRFERVGTTPQGALVVDDYAHHPTEVAAALAAARTLRPARLVAVFQPHLYSRTRAQHREFGAALAAADVVVVTDVYPARERREDFPGVSGLLIAEAACDAAPGRPVHWLPSLDDVAAVLEPRAGDLVVTLGAGDIDGLARRLVQETPAAR